MKGFVVLIWLWVFSGLAGWAQYPQYFHYDSENGLPSSKVYSLLQDPDGFIWIGCDAGLFKYDGVRFISYASPTRQSNSITGLTLSASGKIYGYNFRSQLFCLDQDSLREVPHPCENIYSINTDENHHLYISHFQGISQLDEKTGKWTDYFDLTPDKFVNLETGIPKDGISFLSSVGVGKLKDGKITLDSIGEISAVGSFMLVHFEDAHYIFSNYYNLGYKIKDGKMIDLSQSPLYKILNGRKITHAVLLPDQHIWISTYQGIIRYNPVTGQTTLFYPEMAFSDCLIDREGNYWFSTLHAGLFRIVNMDYRVWNKETGPLSNSKITGITGDGAHIYFATANGTIGQLNTSTYELKAFHTGQNADVQSLDFIPEENRLYANINDLYFLENNTLKRKDIRENSIKSFRKIKEDYILLSSFGVYIIGKSNYKLYEAWARELQYSASQHILWIATNQGVIECRFDNEKWQISQTLLPQTQVLSLAWNEETQTLYALAFDGKIHAYHRGKTTLLTALPDKILVHQLKYGDGQLWVATNKGLWNYGLESGQWSNIQSLDGLASDNVQALHIQGQQIWLATGNGLQKIPLQPAVEKPLARIFLHRPPVNSQLNYGQRLVLHPMAATYISQGQFQFAYRINHSEWIYLPGTITEIQIPNLPSGRFSVEVKAVDYLGRDSENMVAVTGFVHPPFWQKWWFIGGMLMLWFLVLFLVVRRYVTAIRRREHQRTQVVTSQLTALKAQMNPHFIFNVLNSIKSYIYENDRDKATEYLDDFADLIRRTLEMSETQYHDIAEEFKLLKLYIELEAMMLAGEFSYSIQDEGVLDSGLKIPTMILQPFIENAFKHGLRHKLGAKKLTISLQKKSDTEYQIHLTDNGIGQKAAQALNAENRHKKSSFATAAIDKRMALINSHGQQTLAVQTIDLYAPDGQAAGTQVILTIRNQYTDESNYH
jgi:ligand-binding sensor domain-containing protein